MENENDQTQESDDLETVLGAAFDEMEADDIDVENTAEVTDSQTEDSQADANQTDTNQEDQSVEDQQIDDQQDDTAPSSWKPDVASKWAELPAEVKAEIQRRETDYHKSVEGFKHQVEAAQRINPVIEKNQDMIQQSGVAPEQALDYLFNAHRTLTYGSPEQKRAALAQIARDCKIDLTDLKPAAPIDPQMQQLIAQNRQLQQFQQQAVQTQQQAINSEIEQFKSDPNNQHFEAVKQDMAAMLQSGIAQTLQEAYDKAVWARPDLRQSLVEAQRTEAEKRATQAAQRKRAKSAAVGVKGSGPSSTGALPENATLEDTIGAAMDGII